MRSYDLHLKILEENICTIAIRRKHLARANELHVQFIEDK
jgi:hypothetical protein